MNNVANGKTWDYNFSIEQQGNSFVLRSPQITGEFTGLTPEAILQHYLAVVGETINQDLVTGVGETQANYAGTGARSGTLNGMPETTRSGTSSGPAGKSPGIL